MPFAAKAPRYSRKEECEAEFGAGNCEMRQSGGTGSFFMPMMMGYMLGGAFRQPVSWSRQPRDGAIRRLLPAFDGNYPVIGAWVVASRPAGIGIREDDTATTRDTSHFLPQFLE